MANVYVRSGAAGAGTGADWANAYTTLAAALNAKSAGDTFWVSEDHAETQSSIMTLVSPGTAASPCRIICVNHSGTVPPVSADLRTTATVKTTGASNIQFGGVAHSLGIVYTAGNSTSDGRIALGAASAIFFWKIENGGLALGGNNSSSTIVINSALAAASCSVELVNSTLSFANASQTVYSYVGSLKWIRTPSALLGTMPTVLFSAAGSPYPMSLVVEDVDLSALGSSTIVNLSAGIASTIRFIRCKLGTSFALSTSAFTAPSCGALEFINCDSGNTNYKFSRSTYSGVVSHEATIVRSGSATDGTTPFSRKLVSNANSKFYAPLESEPIEFWLDSTASNTFTIYTLTDNVTLTNADFFATAEYLGTSGFPLGVILSSAAADVLATGSNLTTDTSAWTTTGLGTPVKQKIALTFTPASKGPVRIRLHLAKASTTVYVDPNVVTSSGRAWMATSGVINEGLASAAAGAILDGNMNGGLI